MTGGQSQPSLGVKAQAWFAEARANPAFRYGALAALAVAALDQLSKFWIVNSVHLPAQGKIEISGIFDLTYVQNFGASFGHAGWGSNIAGAFVGDLDGRRHGPPDLALADCAGLWR